MDKPFKLPDAWVIRIFERMECIYKKKWTYHYGHHLKKNLYLTMWASALYGLSAEEIKKGLTYCECYPLDLPPTPLEFFAYAKGKVPYPKLKRRLEDNVKVSSIETAQQFMAEIRHKLSNKICST